MHAVVVPRRGLEPGRFRAKERRAFPTKDSVRVSPQPVRAPGERREKLRLRPRVAAARRGVSSACAGVLAGSGTRWICSGTACRTTSAGCAVARNRKRYWSAPSTTLAKNIRRRPATSLSPARALRGRTRRFARLGYDQDPRHTRALIRAVHLHATSRITVPGVPVVPVPLFEALDPRDCARLRAEGRAERRGGAQDGALHRRTHLHVVLCVHNTSRVHRRANRLRIIRFVDVRRAASLLSSVEKGDIDSVSSSSRPSPPWRPSAWRSVRGASRPGSA
jgi:hypothetical protein